MHDDRVLVEARLARFVADRIQPAIYREVRPLEVSAWEVPDEPVSFDEARSQQYQPVAPGWGWGRPWSTAWLRIRGEVPAEWMTGDGSTRVEVLVDLGFTRSRSGFQAEGLAYRADGTLIKAISPLNSWLPCDGSEPIDVFVEAAANPDVAGGYRFAPTLLGSKETAGDASHYELRQVGVALLDVEVWQLVQDVWTLRGLMQELPPASSRRHEILRAFERMLDVLHPSDIAGTATAGRAELADALSRPAASSAHRMIATGHAHIDSAWLWPLRETVRKCARTFTNVMALMDEHPDFVFACSSAQQFDWMKRFYPQVFERIKEKVAAGQFVPVGGMWVESDTNMPGSEAMARQFVVGKRYFLEEFGVECEEAWLPDSFGYSAALPQIVSAAGERWFLTQKISWNQVNRMPHHTFWWEGIDGTRVFTHFPPVDSYSAELSGKELAHAERNFSEKGRATMSLVPFGWGDGGGGPTREMIAAAHRLASLEGSPTVRIDTPRAFFEEAQAEYPDAPVWSGEMYLELHRGVYTSQLRTKQGNRRNEHRLREAEVWATAAAVRHGVPYPHEELARLWRTVLLLQFHDILPGSAIAWVHREAEATHAEVTAELDEIIERSLEALAGSGELALSANAAPFHRDGVASLAIGRGSSLSSASGSSLSRPHQRVTLAEISTSSISGGGAYQLSNGIINATITQHGTITHLSVEKSGTAASNRNVIPPGTVGNLLRLHHDLPNLWDAWDLDAHYKRTVIELPLADSHSIEDTDEGVAITTVRKVGESLITGRVLLRPGEAHLDIEYEVDWRESERVLKLAFPLDVHADRIAAETQYGHVFRSTHVNTSWDAARFEACQHRWVHLGEPGFGVAIANDSSYGYDVSRSTRDDGGTTTTARMTLLRAPRFPDPQSDQGIHRLRFRIAPDAGIPEAVALGYDLNLQRRALTGSREVAPLVTSSTPAIVIEAVKLAEDSSVDDKRADVVVRIYEAFGGRAEGSLSVDFDFESVEFTDLLERPLDGPEPELARLVLRPFQLRTLRFSGVTPR